MDATATKSCAIVVVGAGADTAEIREVHDVRPGMTVGTVLEQVGLAGYRLSRGKGQPFLDTADFMFGAIQQDGEKFFATTPADQGN